MSYQLMMLYAPAWMNLENMLMKGASYKRPPVIKYHQILFHL